MYISWLDSVSDKHEVIGSNPIITTTIRLVLDGIWGIGLYPMTRGSTPWGRTNIKLSGAFELGLKEQKAEKWFDSTYEKQSVHPRLTRADNFIYYYAWLV